MNKVEKCSSAQIGRIVISKDDTEKRIYPNDLQYYVDNGWVTGVKASHRINIGISQIGNQSAKGSIRSEETREKISKTLKSKNLISWSKGLTKETDERIKSISEKQKGKIGPNKGRHFTEEHKNKIGIANKNNVSKYKGIPRDDEVKEKISQSKMGHVVSDDTKAKISETKTGKTLTQDKLLIKTTKQYLTRKKNNSFNSSQAEEDFYTSLLTENANKTIYRQYKDTRYPFYCDFYILEDDLFIEVNAHWSHGGMPYDENNPECQQKLIKWQEQAKKSKFYENAIVTWTKRDVEKRNCAEKNNLKYKVIY